MKQVSAMKYFLLLSLSLFLMLTSSCSTDDEQDNYPEFELQTPDEFADEDYEIYNLFIEQYNKPKIVILQESLFNSSINEMVNYTAEDFGLKSHWKSIYPDFDSALLIRLEEVNRESKFFGPKFNEAEKSIILITEEELNYISEMTPKGNEYFDSFWNFYYDKYPDSQGYLSLSLISYNSLKDQAVIEFANSCGGLCGDYGLAYLRKVNGVWQLADVRILVMS